METTLKAATNLLPYHLLSYGTLLGAEVFQVRPSLGIAVPVPLIIVNPVPL